MTAISSKRRRRTLVAFVFGLVIALCVPVLSYAAVNLIRNSKEGTCKNCEQPEVSIPPTPLSMLATVDAGKVTTITVMALSPPDASGGAKGGTFIVVPVGAETSSPTTGERMRVADVYGSGDAVGLKTAVEGLLGVTISEYAVLDASGTQEFLTPVAPIEVDLTEPVLETAPDGTAHELFPVGTQRLDAAQMAQFLMARAPNEGELDRLERIGEFWTAVSDRIGGGLHTSAPPSTAAAPAPAPGDTGAPQPAVSVGTGPQATTSTAAATSSPELETALGQTNGMRAARDALFDGKTYVYRLSATTSTDASANPSGDDRLLLDSAEVIYVMAKTAPSATSPSQLAVSFWVRSSLGPAATKEAVSRLAFAGANVLLVTEPATTPPPVSTMEYWDPEDQAEAESKVRQLGEVQTVEPTLHVKGINVILTLGENFLEEAGLPSATTTTGARGAVTTTSGSATTVPGTAVGS
jgi:hypothetical protein